jgi:hypothetical protein
MGNPGWITRRASTIGTPSSCDLLKPPLPVVLAVGGIRAVESRGYCPGCPIPGFFCLWLGNREIVQNRQRQEQLQRSKWELEQPLSDRRIELADTKTVTKYVADLRNFINENSLAERKSFIRSFVKAVKVTGDKTLLSYTIPMLPRRLCEETLPVLSIVTFGGEGETRTPTPCGT